MYFDKLLIFRGSPRASDAADYNHMDLVGRAKVPDSIQRADPYAMTSILTGSWGEASAR
jgi:hypothetical protein